MQSVPVLEQQGLPPRPALEAADSREQHESPWPPQTSMPDARPRPSACTRSSLSPLFSVRLTAGRGEHGTGSTSSAGCQGHHTLGACPDMVALACRGGEGWH